ncbi:MAG: alpha/beta hydrolase [Micrococcus sp.]|nr:alpha/beta hydrolase [Micrococcus sp.]
MSDQRPAESIALHVEDSGGEGRPVVLIHGWPASGASWSEQIGPLQETGYRVITYDRRGFGDSAKPDGGFDYDALADDLQRVLMAADASDATLVGFSMGGGEVARYASRHGLDRIRSVVFAAAIPPYLLQGEDNPEGPLDEASYRQMRTALEQDREGFLDGFTTRFFSAGGHLKISEEQRQWALSLSAQADQRAALETIDAWATTDFRGDLEAITVPALIIHGDDDGIVPFEGSGRRTHESLPGSRLEVIEGAPHGLNISHAQEFNRVLLDFLD